MRCVWELPQNALVAQRFGRDFAPAAAGFCRLSLRCCDLLVLGEVYKGHGEVPRRPPCLSRPLLLAGAAEALLCGTGSSDSSRFCRGFASHP